MRGHSQSTSPYFIDVQELGCSWTIGSLLKSTVWLDYSALTQIQTKSDKCHSALKKRGWREGKQGKELAAKANLSSIPGAHREEKRTDFLKLLSDFHMCTVARVPTCM